MAPFAHPTVAELTSASTWALIEDKISPFGLATINKVIAFVQDECMPSEEVYHAQLPHDPVQRWKTIVPVMEELKVKARKQGLWNLFLSKRHYPKFGVDLTNLEYAVIAEILGRSPHIASQAMNCSAPDTGNMEVLTRYGTPEQQEKWLLPLLDGKIRSSFAMTEYGVASSDATNIKASILPHPKDPSKVIINAHKWWISGAGDPRCKVHLLMGKSDPSNPDRHKQQTMVIIPADAPGVKVVRPLTVMGFDDAPEGHCEIIYKDVVVPKENLIGGWGRGFEIIQGRLGPGRIHHCMRTIGNAQRALDLMIERVTDPSRTTFGKRLVEHGTVLADIAKSRAEIEGARLLVLSAALQIDRVLAKGAMKEIGIAKFVVPAMALQVIDRAMQSYGAEGICSDAPLANMWAGIRTLRYADGPDEVHIQQIGKTEVKRAPALRERTQRIKERTAMFNAQNGVKAKL